MAAERSEIGVFELPAFGGSPEMGQCISDPLPASCPGTHLNQCTEQERDAMIYVARAA